MRFLRSTKKKVQKTNENPVFSPDVGAVVCLQRCFVRFLARLLIRSNILINVIQRVLVWFVINIRSGGWSRTRRELPIVRLYRAGLSCDWPGVDTIWSRD